MIDRHRADKGRDRGGTIHAQGRRISKPLTNFAGDPKSIRPPAPAQPFPELPPQRQGWRGCRTRLLAEFATASHMPELRQHAQGFRIARSSARPPVFGSMFAVYLPYAAPAAARSVFKVLILLASPTGFEPVLPP